VPRLWEHTVEAHRRAVRDAAVDAAAALVAERGLVSVTMTEVARRTGIGRATLYKYFSDVESILIAWHERQVGRHLERLITVRDESREPSRRVRAVLETYALLASQTPDTHLATVLHGGEHVLHAQRQLRQVITEVLADGVRAGVVRDDIPVAELARYCLHALSAAATLTSNHAVERLVTVTLTGLGMVSPGIRVRAGARPSQGLSGKGPRR
jgi:AcrR family transcriptional regulator